MTLPTDDELLSAARNGDRMALDTLLRAHRHGVYRYGLRVCPTTEDAEDAVQETLWAATRAIRSFRGPASSIANWMFTIVRRMCFRFIDGHRRAAADRVVADDPLPIASLGPEDVVAERQRAELLSAGLRALDPLHREVVLLRDIQGITAPEAAGRLGISLEALKSRLHRARANLRAQILARAGAG